MAANNEHPTTFTCSKRPGNNPAQGARPENKERASRVRNRISPMMMNKGSATSSEVVRIFHVYCGSSLSSGIERKL